MQMNAIIYYADMPAVVPYTDSGFLSSEYKESIGAQIMHHRSSWMDKLLLYILYMARLIAALTKSYNVCGCFGGSFSPERLLR